MTSPLLNASTARRIFRGSGCSGLTSRIMAERSAPLYQSATATTNRTPQSALLASCRPGRWRGKMSRGVHAVPQDRQHLCMHLCEVALHVAEIDGGLHDDTSEVSLMSSLVAV